MKLKKLLSLVIALAIFTSLPLALTSAQSSPTNDTLARNQYEANIAYNNILSSFLTTDNEYQYNDNYAGAYLNPSGNLVILITTRSDVQESQVSYGESKSNVLTDAVSTGSTAFKNMTDEFISAAQELYELTGAGKETNILFQEATYSYKYLRSTFDKTGEVFLRTEENPYRSVLPPVAFMGIDDEKNCIYIGIVDINNEKIEQVLSIIGNKELYRFENADGCPEQFLNCYAGDVVDGDTITAGILRGSIGYRARRYDSSLNTYQYGFVTAGHLISKNTVAKKSSTRIGVCRDSKNDTSLDAAFVETDTGWDMQAVTTNGYNITALLQLPGKNTEVFKEGQATGRSYGVVTATCTRYYYNNYASYTDNVIETSCNGASGDSGGIVYTNSNVVAGIVLGGVLNTADNTWHLWAAATTVIYQGLGGSNSVIPW